MKWHANFNNTILSEAYIFPVLLFTYLGDFQFGFTIALGAFLTYPSDIPSSLKHKINGVLVTTFLISGVNLLVNIIYPYPWVFYPFLTVILFSLSQLFNLFGF